MMHENYSPRGFRFLPVVVKNLLIINGLCFLAYFVMISYGINLNKIFGMHYFASEDFKFYQIITYMFMHGNLTHLIFNMFAFWMFGYLLENVWGSKKFIIYYFVTGLGAIMIHMLVCFIQFFPIANAIDIYVNNPNPTDFIYIIEKYFKGYYDKDKMSLFHTAYFSKAESIEILNMLYKARISIPTVGASGAVFGILLAFGMMFPEHRIYLYFLFPIKAKWFVLIYGALELWLGISRPDSGIAHFAHLGGMVFGYFLVRHWKKKQFDRFLY